MTATTAAQSHRTDTPADAPAGDLVYDHGAVLFGDCLDRLAADLPDNSIDSIVTDPPYELGFDGRAWDRTGIAFNPAVWAECLRVLKPGGHLLAAGATRTYHRMVCAVEDAGFEIRDSIHWTYATGLPRAQNLKPSHEPFVLARKPLEGSQAANVRRHGTGALNTADLLIPITDAAYYANCSGDRGHAGTRTRDGATTITTGGGKAGAGRRPANTLIGHCPTCGLDACDPGCLVSELGERAKYFTVFRWDRKPSAAERNAGVPGGNTHNTIKPVSLMRWLVTLVTPPGGVVLDPFLGSGTTAVAATLDGYKFIGCELTADYLPICDGRIRHALDQAAQAGTADGPDENQLALFDDED